MLTVGWQFLKKIKEKKKRRKEKTTVVRLLFYFPKMLKLMF